MTQETRSSSACRFDLDFSSNVSISTDEQRARVEAPARRDEGLAEPRYEFHLPAGKPSQE